MKTIYELTEEQWMKSPSNNWLKQHGFAMFRKKKRGRKKHEQEYLKLPF